MLSQHESSSFNSRDMGALIHATHFAAFKHRHQRRKDDVTPYINHPIALMQILWNESNIDDTVVILAALLHDTVEDTDTTFAELESTFGSEVTEVVRQVTDDKSLPKSARKQLQIDHAPHLSDRAKLVKLADKTANLRDMAISPPADWPLQRQYDYFEWAKTVVDRLRGVHPKLEALFDQAYHDGLTCLNQRRAIALSAEES